MQKIEKWRIQELALVLNHLIELLKNGKSYYHTHLLHIVFNHSEFSKKDKMEFCIEVLRNSNGLTAKNQAGKIFEKLAGDKNLKWMPFTEIDKFLHWWEKHTDNKN